MALELGGEIGVDDGMDVCGNGELDGDVEL